jgi:hypothetical protein
MHGSMSAAGGNQASRLSRAAQAPPADPTATEASTTSLPGADTKALAQAERLRRLSSLSGRPRGSGVRVTHPGRHADAPPPGNVRSRVDGRATYVATARALTREGLVNRELLDVRGPLQLGAGGGHGGSDPRLERVEVLARLPEVDHTPPFVDRA